jgi:thiol-disulfide isomerase/thioredoxin
MRLVLPLVVIVAIALTAVAAYQALRPAGESAPVPRAAPAPGAFVFRTHAAPRALPELAFEDGEGSPRSLADFRGKVVLLNVWATWCLPCREEMPALDRLQQQLGGRDFEVLALSIDSGGAPAVKRFYEEIGIRALGIYVDPTTRAGSALAAFGIPVTLLIDRQGREIGRHLGIAEWDGPDAVRVIQSYLNGNARQ